VALPGKKRYSGLNDNRNKENKWTQSIAVGSKTFIEKMKKALGYGAKVRKTISADDTFELLETIAPFGNADKNVRLICRPKGYKKWISMKKRLMISP
jgi:hypothetical protein